jgi:hypothetical protein
LQSSEITATGRKGKLLKEDVLKYIADRKLKPKAPKEGNIINEVVCDVFFNPETKYVRLFAINPNI